MSHDVMTVLEAGKANLAVTDEQVLEFATSRGRAVLTLNRKHFIRLHAERPVHAGIIVCTYDPAFHEQASRIHDLIERFGDLSGKLLRVNRPQ